MTYRPATTKAPSMTLETTAAALGLLMSISSVVTGAFVVGLTIQTIRDRGPRASAPLRCYAGRFDLACFSATSSSIRSARLTDEESGKARATSASSRTTFVSAWYAA